MQGAPNADPFNICPVPYQPWFGAVMDYWYAQVMPLAALITGSGWDLAPFKTETQRLMWSDPATFYVSIQAAIGMLNSPALEYVAPAV